MDIKDEYEKLLPMTNWTDEEILAFIDEQCNQNGPIENISVECSLEEYMKKTGAQLIDDVIKEIQVTLGPISGE